MKLSCLHENLEDNIKQAMGLAYFKKMADPNRPEKMGDANSMLPGRSGNQDTPLKPRHRRFFNAPTGGGPTKAGYGDQDDFESRRPRENMMGEPEPDKDYPLDKSLEDEAIEKQARKTYGKQAQAGAPVHRP